MGFNLFAESGCQPTSFKIREKKMDGRIFYETDQDELRNLLHEIQTRKVKINLNLFLNGHRQSRKSSAANADVVRKRRNQDLANPSTSKVSTDTQTASWALKMSRKKDDSTLCQPGKTEGDLTSILIACNEIEDSEEKALKEKSETDSRLGKKCRKERVSKLIDRKTKIYDHSGILDDSCQLDKSWQEFFERTGAGIEWKSHTTVVNDTKDNGLISSAGENAEDADDCKVVFEKKAEIGCAFCEQTFEDKKALMIHSAKVHNQAEKNIKYSNRIKLKCAFCPEVYEKSTLLMVHVAVQHPHIVSTLKSCSGDKNRQKGAENLVAGNCGEDVATETKPLLSLHSKSLEYDLSTADKSNNQPSDSFKSKQDPSPPRRFFPCSLCLAKFRFKKYWLEHFEQAHAYIGNKINGKYECPNCSLGFKNSKLLMTHIFESHTQVQGNDRLVHWTPGRTRHPTVSSATTSPFMPYSLENISSIPFSSSRASSVFACANCSENFENIQDLMEHRNEKHLTPLIRHDVLFNKIFNTDGVANSDYCYLENYDRATTSTNGYSIRSENYF